MAVNNPKQKPLNATPPPASVTLQLPTLPGVAVQQIPVGFGTILMFTCAPQDLARFAQYLRAWLDEYVGAEIKKEEARQKDIRQFVIQQNKEEERRTLQRLLDAVPAPATKKAFQAPNSDVEVIVTSAAAPMNPEMVHEVAEAMRATPDATLTPTEVAMREAIAAHDAFLRKKEIEDAEEAARMVLPSPTTVPAPQEGQSGWEPDPFPATAAKDIGVINPAVFPKG